MSSRKRAAPAAVVARWRTQSGAALDICDAANDNALDAPGDALLRTALRLFAEHGLGAGHRAQAHAEAAFFDGERERYRWWLAVTRTLDRKLAVELSGRMGSELFGSQSLPRR